MNMNEQICFSRRTAIKRNETALDEQLNVHPVPPSQGKAYRQRKFINQEQLDPNQQPNPAAVKGLALQYGARYVNKSMD